MRKKNCFLNDKNKNIFVSTALVHLKEKYIFLDLTYHDITRPEADHVMHHYKTLCVPLRSRQPKKSSSRIVLVDDQLQILRKFFVYKGPGYNFRNGKTSCYLILEVLVQLKLSRIYVKLMTVVSNHS